MRGSSWPRRRKDAEAPQLPYCVWRVAMVYKNPPPAFQILPLDLMNFRTVIDEHVPCFAKLMLIFGEAGDHPNVWSKLPGAPGAFLALCPIAERHAS